MEYKFLSIEEYDYNPFRLNDYGFQITLQAEYAIGAGGNGLVNISYSHVDENIWDVPDIKVSFEDSSDDLDGLIETMKEAVAWLKENDEVVKDMKERFLNMINSPDYIKE
jgi:hypothetical protein